MIKVLKNLRISCASVVLLWVLFLILLYTGIIDKITPCGAYGALPESAKEIKVYYKCVGFTMDYVRVVKAKIPESDFRTFALAVGFIPQNYSEDIVWAMSEDSAPDEWWNPPDDIVKEGYFYQEDEFIKCLKYHNGYIYYYETKW